MKLLTFPGQGTPISVPVFKALLRNKAKEFDRIVADNGPKTRELIDFVVRNQASPGSIAVCSNLFYQLYSILNSRTRGGALRDHKSPYLLLGHSLGELTCLSVNGLFTLKDLFDIANYRNELMVKYTEKYLIAHKMNHSTKFEMWALSSPRATNLPLQINHVTTLPQCHGAHSLDTQTSTRSNNVSSQGVIEDLEKLRIECQSRFPALRITELTNPNNVAFHNSTVLRPIQEPLYDYIWDVLKLNHQNTTTQLQYPIVSNLDGRLSHLVHHAIERFVRCSSTTVQFTYCYDTINQLSGQIDGGAVCMGPGNVIYNLIRRNCNIDAHEYSTLATVDQYQNTIAEGGASTQG
ncbi:[acyl-carrier-protein] S-malonyltransferase KNAG_0A03130 [Huiozyma naganishii CBS 8797]|uniref:[acyl-carrier-protein] S-malonyltransferase n=1 Tax=Huiozyma naganishii (strain ATCC MYA-139 / BCRC 22969 / CBS 8797 / KCTC 17520 / NBRC 10181 / NCYC 3082 / Yp74L-3) TaxID=1071383 RepID=J7S3J1_HUIN7|nr:hypothetical protein KNAG_0A03130 [Kazachstania naganishii CBS 8797]CCK68001.1 hypothetical protein KNAG_0A03130 [Kazachstania naganishii CBS 8797]